jgi:predicted phosphodiesterase
MKKTVKIACISDIHNKQKDIELPEDIDILLVAGDLTLRGRAKEL